MIKVWQWRTGRRLYDIVIEEVVHPFIAVRRARPKRGYDSDGERKPTRRRWLARQRRKEAKVAAAATKLSEDDVDTVPEAEGAEAEVDVEDVDVDDDERNESEDQTVATPAPASGEPEEPPPAPVLVVQKIESLKIDGQLVIVFSAVGYVSDREWLGFISFTDNLTPPSATALFWFALPLDPADAISEEVLVHNHDLGRPVVTFTPVFGSPDCVCVSLDAHRSGDGLPDVPLHVRLVRLGPDSVCRNIAYTVIFSSYYRVGERSFSCTTIAINVKQRIHYPRWAYFILFLCLYLWLNRQDVS